MIASYQIATQRRDAAVEMRVLVRSGLPVEHVPITYDEMMTRPIEWDGEAA